MTSMGQTAQVQVEMPRVPQLEQWQDCAFMFLSQQSVSAEKVRLQFASILAQPQDEKGARTRRMLADLVSPKLPVQSPRFVWFDYLSFPVADCMKRIEELGICAFTHTRLFDLSAEEIDDLAESEREWKEGRGRRFKDAKSAIEWLNDSDIP